MAGARPVRQLCIYVGFQSPIPCMKHDLCLDDSQELVRAP